MKPSLREITIRVAPNGGFTVTAPGMLGSSLPQLLAAFGNIRELSEWIRTQSWETGELNVE